MKATRLVVLGLMLVLGACAEMPRDHGAVIVAWEGKLGGCACDARAQRVTVIGTGLAAQAGCSPLRFHVLRSDALGAYSWASGDIYLTAGLVDRAADDEIAGAIAHELGHLLNDGQMHTVVALRGFDGPLDVEQRADWVGCQLLVGTGRSPEALVRVLEKVCAAAPSRECRAAIGVRIAAIQRRFPN